MSINNEAIGISAEVAIAKSFDISINPHYEDRADKTIVDLLMKNNNVKRIFKKERIPDPVSHIAEGRSPIDFILTDNKSLLGKVAPQIIGQPTAETYFTYLEQYFSNFNVTEKLNAEGLKDTYKNRAYIFKKFSIDNIAAVTEMYWKNLFDCDYYLHFFNLYSYSNPLDNYVLLGKA